MKAAILAFTKYHLAMGRAIGLSWSFYLALVVSATLLGLGSPFEHGVHRLRPRGLVLCSKDKDLCSKDRSLESRGRLLELKCREMEVRDELSRIAEEKEKLLRTRPLSIGIVGFGKFGQFLARRFLLQGHKVTALSRAGSSPDAVELGVEYFGGLGGGGDGSDDGPLAFCSQEDLDVVVFAVSILSFEQTLAGLPLTQLAAVPHGPRPKERGGVVLVDVLSVKVHPKFVFASFAPPTCDVLCTHPMFGPESGRGSWAALPFVFERVEGRYENKDVVERFLSIFETEGCDMVEMTAQEHDLASANSQVQERERERETRGPAGISRAAAWGGPTSRPLSQEGRATNPSLFSRPVGPSRFLPAHLRPRPGPRPQSPIPPPFFWRSLRRTWWGGSWSSCGCTRPPSTRRRSGACWRSRTPWRGTASTSSTASTSITPTPSTRSSSCARLCWTSSGASRRWTQGTWGPWAGKRATADRTDRRRTSGEGLTWIWPLALRLEFCSHSPGMPRAGRLEPDTRESKATA